MMYSSAAAAAGPGAERSAQAQALVDRRPRSRCRESYPSRCKTVASSRARQLGACVAACATIATALAVATRAYDLPSLVDTFLSPGGGADPPPKWAYRELEDSMRAPGWTYFQRLRTLAGWPHPTRVREPAEAEVELVCCLHQGNVRALRALPPRPAHRPYLVWMEAIRWHRCHQSPNWLRVGCTLFEQVRQQRADLLFASFDIGPGKFVAFAPPHFWRHPPPSDLSRWKYFATCRGTLKENVGLAGTVRADLQRELGTPQADARVAAELAARGVAVELFSMRWNETRAVTAAEIQRYKALMDTAYALVPRGDGLWSYRFSDAVGACAVPVTLADKLHLPFAPIVDWSGAALALPEALAKDRQRLLAALPSDRAAITRMRERVCEINRRYFRTERARWNALLRSAVALAAAPNATGGSEPR